MTTRIATIKAKRTTTRQEMIEFLNSEEIMEKITGKEGERRSTVFKDMTRAQAWRLFLDEATDCEEEQMELRTFQNIKREFC